MGYLYGVRYRPMRHLLRITTCDAIWRFLHLRGQDIMSGGKGRQAAFDDKVSQKGVNSLHLLRDLAA